jgi:hypothetical protein
VDLNVSAIAVKLGLVAAVIVAVIALLRALIATAQRRSLSSRASALAEPAARLGLMPIESSGVPDDVPPFELLNTGKDRRASNVLRGSVGVNQVAVFDYAFYDQTASRPASFRTVYYDQHFAGCTVACVKGPWLSLPAFVMEPSFAQAISRAEQQIAAQLGDGKMATAAQRLMHAAEAFAVDVPGWGYPERPDFEYRLRGKDEPAVRALFTPPVLDYFSQHKEWIVEASGDWLLVAFPMRFQPRAASTSTYSHDEGRLPAERLEDLVHSAVATLDVLRQDRRV